MKQILINSFSVLILTISLSCLYINSQVTSNAIITNTDFELRGNQLIITYDIEYYSGNQKFTVNTEIFYESGEKISAKSLTGDIDKNIKGGENKTIIWDLNKDKVELDGRIYVEVTAVPELIAETKKETEKSFSLAGTVAPSVVFPGYGNTRITRKPYWILGLAGYGSLVTSYMFNHSASLSYDEYLNEKNDRALRSSNYDDAEADKQISVVFGVSACVIWAADITLLVVNYKKQKKNLSSASKPKTSFGYSYSTQLGANMLTLKITL